MLRSLSCACVALLWMAGATAAEELVVHQRDKAFDRETMTVKVGAKVTFMNEDEIAHNVLSRSSGNAFDLGAQKPGECGTATFKSAGTVEVICAIHPKMKMTIEVQP